MLPVILVTHDHKNTLRYLRDKLPGLRKQRLRPEQSFLLSIMGPEGPLILVNVHNAAQLTAAAEMLKQQGRLNPTQPLVLLK